MASINFNEIYSTFLGKITDYNLPNMEEEIAYEIMLGYLRSTIAEPNIRGIFTVLKLDTYEEKIDYQLKVSANDDEEFTTELLARGMVVQWLKPQVNSVVNTAQMFGGSDQKWFSQEKHLSGLKDLLDTVKNELGKFIRDRGSVYNPYLRGKYYGT